MHLRAYGRGVATVMAMVALLIVCSSRAAAQATTGLPIETGVTPPAGAATMYGVPLSLGSNPYPAMMQMGIYNQGATSAAETQRFQQQMMAQLGLQTGGARVVQPQPQAAFAAAPAYAQPTQAQFNAYPQQQQAQHFGSINNAAAVPPQQQQQYAAANQYPAQQQPAYQPQSQMQPQQLQQAAFPQQQQPMYPQPQQQQQWAPQGAPFQQQGAPQQGGAPPQQPPWAGQPQQQQQPQQPPWAAQQQQQPQQPPWAAQQQQGPAGPGPNAAGSGQQQPGRPPFAVGGADGRPAAPSIDSLLAAMGAANDAAAQQLQQQQQQQSSVAPPRGAPASSAAGGAVGLPAGIDASVLTPTRARPSSCGPNDFECQFVQSCYGCYSDHALPYCGACLDLLQCKADQACQMNKAKAACAQLAAAGQAQQPVCKMLGA